MIAPPACDGRTAPEARDGAVEPEILVRGLGVRAGDRQVLKDLDFEAAPRTVTGLMGPMGGGKSTLLKFLAGRLDAGLSATCARALHRGAPIGVHGLPALVRQHVREAAGCAEESARMAAGRIAEIEAAVAGGDRMLCVDEPTAGLAAADGARVMARLREIGARSAVVVVSHNAAEVAAHCTHAALCAGGRIVAAAPVAAFFGDGAGAEVLHFLTTGSIALPRPDTPAAHLAPDLRAAPAGFDTGAAPTRGPAVVIAGALAVERIEIDETGAPLAPVEEGHRVLALLPDAVVVSDARGGRDRLDWPDAARPGEAGLDGALAAARRLDALLVQGARVTLAPGANPGGAAALLGVFLVLRGFPPDKAAEAAQAKLPQILLGLRIEQMLWDVEIALEMEAPAA